MRIHRPVFFLFPLFVPAIAMALPGVPGTSSRPRSALQFCPHLDQRLLVEASACEPRAPDQKLMRLELGGQRTKARARVAAAADQILIQIRAGQIEAARESLSHILLGLEMLDYLETLSSREQVTSASLDIVAAGLSTGVVSGFVMMYLGRYGISPDLLKGGGVLSALSIFGFIPLQDVRYEVGVKHMRVPGAAWLAKWRRKRPGGEWTEIQSFLRTEVRELDSLPALGRAISEALETVTLAEACRSALLGGGNAKVSDQSEGKT